jgi:hypothetical protein
MRDPTHDPTAREAISRTLGFDSRRLSRDFADEQALVDQHFAEERLRVRPWNHRERAARAAAIERLKADAEARPRAYR